MDRVGDFNTRLPFRHSDPKIVSNCCNTNIHRLPIEPFHQVFEKSLHGINHRNKFSADSSNPLVAFLPHAQTGTQTAIIVARYLLPDSLRRRLQPGSTGMHSLRRAYFTARTRVHCIPRSRKLRPDNFIVPSSMGGQ
jgi:hypothetical protein